MHPILLLAKNSINQFITKKIKIKPPKELPKEMEGKAGVFVSIKKKKFLRGCIGTFSPVQKNIAFEIIENAISASTMDPRFPSISIEELEELEISVDILSEPEKIYSIEDLNPKKYGVIVTKGIKRGLLLPNLEGVHTVDYQLEIAKKKAGIKVEENVDIMRFEVKRYK